MAELTNINFSNYLVEAATYQKIQNIPAEDLLQGIQYQYNGKIYNLTILETKHPDNENMLLVFRIYSNDTFQGIIYQPTKEEDGDQGSERVNDLIVNIYQGTSINLRAFLGTGRQIDHIMEHPEEGEGDPVRKEIENPVYDGEIPQDALFSKIAFPRDTQNGVVTPIRQLPAAAKPKAAPQKPKAPATGNNNPPPPSDNKWTTGQKRGFFLIALLATAVLGYGAKKVFFNKPPAPKPPAVV
ncbi:MAG: hypothetical protein KDK76_04720 [Chlamydiia bacterium]|nr:hypothetical protein [Chlamydiia bacterium]